MTIWNKKNGMFKAMVAFIAVVAVVFAVPGCGKKVAVETGGTEYEPGSQILPLAEPVTLTYWAGNAAAGTLSSYSEMGMYQELEKKTNVKIDFIHPVANQSTEQFNIMIASRDYPDIIEGMVIYQGGFAKAEQDGVIADLAPLQEAYAPNITKLYEAYPQIKSLVQSETGKIYTTPMIRGGNILRTYKGILLRKDWMDELGLALPETMDELHDVLLAFKEKKGATAPLTIDIRNLKSEPLLGAYGLYINYSVDDNGKVIYGPYDPRFKEYVRTMRQWYQEGLIDQEAAVTNGKIMDANIFGNKSGAYIAGIGGGFTKYLTAPQVQGTSFDLVAAPYPVLKKGEPHPYMHRDPLVQPHLGASVSATGKHIPVAVALLDFFYGKEGHMLANFGVEGVSYTMQDGKPVFTEEVTKNPDGLGMSAAGLKYARSFNAGPFVQDTRYGEQFYALPEQRAATAMWTEQFKAGSMKNHTVLGDPNDEELEIISDKQTDISTYADEKFLEWLMTPDNGNFDAEFEQYRADLKKLGIEEVLAAKQAAYDRYVAKNPEAVQDGAFDVSEFFWN